MENVTVNGFTDLIKIGVKDNVTYYLKINSTCSSVLVSHSCPKESEVADTGTYEVKEGSSYSFTETVGVSVEVGFDIPFVASGSVTVNGEISATQAFSKETTTSVNYSVSPGTTYVLYEAIMTVSYYSSFIFPLSPTGVALIKTADDIIYTGVTKGEVINN